MKFRLRSNFCLFFIFALLAVSSSVSYSTVYVKSDAGGSTHNGKTWATAFHTIQEGINAASANKDEVWVARGSYSGNETIAVGVSLYGGFTGAETSKSQRNWKTNVTTINNGMAETVSCNSDSRLDGFTVNKGTLQSILCLSGTITIANCIITGEYSGIESDSSSTPVITNNTIYECYEGIVCYNAVITNNVIKNCDWASVFCQRSATISNNLIIASRYGIECENSSPIITNNTIVGAVTGYGAGYYSSAKVSNNIIAYCGTGVDKPYYANSITLSHNDVYGCDTAYAGTNPGSTDIQLDPKFSNYKGGNLHLMSNSPCLNAGDAKAGGMTNTDIDGNSRVMDGIVDIGADEFDGTNWPSSTPIIYVNASNSLTTGDGSSWANAFKTISAALDAASACGGAEVWVAKGIYNEELDLQPFTYLYGGFSANEVTRDQRNLKLNSTIITGENLSYAVKMSGITTVDGFTFRNFYYGITARSAGNLIANNVITGCTEDAISCQATMQTTVVNNTVSCCKVGISTTDMGNPTILNNTVVLNTTGIESVWENKANVLNNIIAFNTKGFSSVNASPSFSYNDVYGNTVDYDGLQPGVSNISADPLFAGLESGNFHIQPNSPCKDKGSNTALLPAKDIEGDSRILNGTVDIGSDESDGTVWQNVRPVVYVKSTALNGGDGSTWSKAFKTIQAGVDALKGKGGGEVWIAKGTYNETVVLSSFISIYGGFSGSETVKEQRNWSLNPTIIDGGSSYATIVTAANKCQVDGFTLRNGNYGVCTRDASCQVSNNIIVGMAESAVFCSGGSAIVTNNFINQSYYYGVDCYGGNPVVTNNTIINNAYGIYIHYDSSPIISNNIIAYNEYDGIFRYGGNTVLTCNDVYGNGQNYFWIDPGKGDISVDPGFVAAGDYHISKNSPCRNSGDNSARSLPLDDIDYNGRIGDGRVDIGADEYWDPCITIVSVKLARNDEKVDIADAIVTGANSGLLYIESEDRHCGIRVSKFMHGLKAGMRVHVTGLTKTTSDGERYIAADTAVQTGSGTVDPVYMTNITMGGSDYNYVPMRSGQQGVINATGLNNIGLLVKTTGRVVLSTSSTFDITDGSGENVQVSVPSGIPIPALNSYVSVVGNSSCRKVSNGLMRVIRPYAASNIVILQKPDGSIP